MPMTLMSSMTDSRYWIASAPGRLPLACPESHRTLMTTTKALIAGAAIVAASLLGTACSGSNEPQGAADRATAASAGPVVKREGAGEVRVDRLGGSGPVLAKINFDSGPMSYFGVKSGADASSVLVDSIGPWSGTTLVPSKEDLSVDTLGSWTVQFAPLSSARKLGDDTTKGTVPSVLAVPKGSAREVKVEFSRPDAPFVDTAPFRVKVFKDNEFSDVFSSAGRSGSGSFQVPGGSYVVVADNGAWSLTMN